MYRRIHCCLQNKFLLHGSPDRIHLLSEEITKYSLFGMDISVYFQKLVLTLWTDFMGEIIFLHRFQIMGGS